MPDGENVGQAENQDKKKKGKLNDKTKWLLIGGGLILAAIVFYAVRSANKNSNSGLTNTSPNPNDIYGAGTGTGAYGNSIDPLTGDISGTPQDLADLQSMYGYSGSSTGGVPTSGGGGGGGGTTGQGGSNGFAIPGFQTYAPGGKSLSQMASYYGISLSSLEAKDPNAFKQYGANKALPKGRGLWVPAQTIAGNSTGIKFG